MATEDKNKLSKENLFIIKSNMLTRECHSAPQSPGKMICKEVNGSAGYSPQSKENNFSNINGNMYTHEYPFNCPIICASNVEEAKNKNEPTLFNNVLKEINYKNSPQTETPDEEEKLITSYEATTGYTFLKLLYSGMSDVWQGIKDGIYVAIKVISCNYVSSDLILNEININNHLKKYQQRNILSMIDYNMDNKNTFLIFDYAENKTVFELIKSQENPLPLLIVYAIFSQVLNAVEFIHSLKIAHRDIKNENCLITKTGDVKLCDFAGSYKLSSEKNVEPRLTKEYFSPEIRNGNGLDIDWFSYDMWCLGVLLHELLFPRFPLENISTDKYLKERSIIWKGLNANVTALLKNCQIQAKYRSSAADLRSSNQWLLESEKFLTLHSLKPENIIESYFENCVIQIGLDVMEDIGKNAIESNILLDEEYFSSEINLEDNVTPKKIDANSQMSILMELIDQYNTIFN